MERDENYYKELLKLYLENRCNPAQLEEVLVYLEQDSSNRILLLQLKEQFDDSFTSPSTISPEQSQQIRKALLNRITVTKVILMKKRRWQLIAAAAAVFIMTAAGYYFSKEDNSIQVPDLAKTRVKNNPYKDDVLPGGDRAILTLADGTTIVLDEAKNGDLASQGNTRVIKLNGKLAYDPTKNHTGEIVYNTISTPRGGKYQIELPDGSQVWLNAASSIHFPTAFIGKTRTVEMTGEAYFEIARNKEMPFVVSVNGAEIQVVGTHFNVMAYNEEDAVKTTLLEGSVKCIKGHNSKLLKPGQQSQLLKNGQIKVVSNVDVDYVISWKNGMFHFESADIETVMRQLARWYDVEVIFKSKKIYDPLHAEIPLNTKLSDALKALELAGSATFEIEGRKIIVAQ